jgi:hypothetical protein
MRSWTLARVAPATRDRVLRQLSPAGRAAGFGERSALRPTGSSGDRSPNDHRRLETLRKLSTSSTGTTARCTAARASALSSGLSTSTAVCGLPPQARGIGRPTDTSGAWTVCVWRSATSLPRVVESARQSSLDLSEESPLSMLAADAATAGQLGSTVRPRARPLRPGAGHADWGGATAWRCVKTRRVN